MGKKIRIGLDFDGVVAYNPARVIRPHVKWFKEKVLGKKKLSFMVPRNPIVKILWILAHESSIFPAKGTKLLFEAAKKDNIEFHLITGRFPLLERNLMKWLERNKLDKVFRSINLNEKIEQPHEFKMRMIKTLDLDYYVEDNWDIVDYLNNKTRTKILWIYNLADKNKKFDNKYPYLEKALQRILG